VIIGLWPASISERVTAFRIESVVDFAAEAERYVFRDPSCEHFSKRFSYSS
jgi:hypothetical protein